MCLVTPFSHCVVMLDYPAYQSNNLVIVIFLFVKYRWDVFKRLFCLLEIKGTYLKGMSLEMDLAFDKVSRTRTPCFSVNSASGLFCCLQHIPNSLFTVTGVKEEVHYTCTSTTTL
jgi:hypothetical protein